MAQSFVTPIRAGTKALPEKVFEACDQLAESKGTIRNEDVLDVRPLKGPNHATKIVSY